MALFADKKTERKIKLLREREKEDLAKLLSKKYGVEYGDLSRVSIDTDALKLIPEGVAKENKVAVFSKLEKNVNVAAHSPKDDGVTNVLEEFLYPTTCIFNLFEIIFSTPSKAPPAINKIF